MYTTPPSAARLARRAHAGVSLQASMVDPEALHRLGPLSRSGTHGGAHGRSNDPIASPFHGMRCPPDHHLFASWQWLPHTACSLEAIDMTVQ
jgi:hypothetical protein